MAGPPDESEHPLSGLLRMLVPMEFGRSLSKVPFFSTLDLLFLRARTQKGYSAVRVQFTDAADPASVRRSVRHMGVHTTSFREQCDRLETLFLVVDLALGTIGTIVLLVAVLGIANTVMMNVRERTREIGIMRAVGGDTRDLQRLFVVESAGLGALGDAAGLTVGGLLVAGLDWGVNLYLNSLGAPPITVLDTSLLVALAIWAGSVLVSLLAGIVPARRAARVEPAETLRPW